MIEGLKPYGEYRESGVNWLGEIPAHWQIRRLKYILREKDTRSLDGKEQLLRVSQYTGVTQRLRKDRDGEQDTRAKSLIGYKQVLPEELVINIMLAWNGSMGVSRFEGIASPAYCVYRFQPNSNPWYFHHLLRSPSSLARIKTASTGVIESRLRLYSDDLFRIEAPLPPPDEQAAIVRFLDHANQRIDRFIRTKKKIIALLNEQKQSIIHRAVTRGVDPDVKMKDSGIPWLGEMPEHWDLSALRRYWEVVDCKHLTVPFAEDGVPLASVVEVQRFMLDLSSCKKTKPEWYRLLIEGGRKPKRGDLIYCRNASVGACAFVDIDIDFAMGQDVCLIRSKNQNQKFLNYFLHSPFMKHQLEFLLVGSTFKRINISDIKALTILVPPIEDQNAICKYLDDRLCDFEKAANRVENEIDLIKQYRSRLIADVVTGKLDVREAVRALPTAVEDNPLEAESEDLDEESELESEPTGAAA